MARALTGIRPAGPPGFIVARLLGAAAATGLFRWLVPARPAAVFRVAEEAERTAQAGARR